MQTRSQTHMNNNNSSVVEVVECNYNLRSKTKKELYEVNIDFDGASRAWKKNKISIGNGSYKYKTDKKRRYPTIPTFPLV